MTRVILIRHAKSGWDDPMAEDHDRKLTERGHKAARAIGAWMFSYGYVPDVILCSDAMRTQQTAAGIMEALGDGPQLKLQPLLYHPAPDTIIDLVAHETAQVVAVISHNPGIGMAAQALVRERPDHRRFSDYPTCATTVVDFDERIRIQDGTCVDFIVPRDLTD